MNKPERAYVLDLRVEADSLDDLIGYLRSFETELYMEQVSTGVSGGYSAGSIYSLKINEGVTHDSWWQEMQKYLPHLSSGEVGGE